MAKKILLIEDYQATVGMMTGFLKMNGYDLDFAYDGHTGLQKAGGWKPDLILLDIMMPEMNGLEVCKRLKADHDTAAIPVVVVSVRSLEDDIKAAKAVGAVDYIVKPFEPQKLLEVVKKYI